MTFLYPTASTVAIFSNGYHIEQAYQIQYKETVNKIPIYGYNDYNYSKIAVGRTLVQGVLVINYIFAGYLNALLDASYKKNDSFVPRLYNYNIVETDESQKIKLKERIKSNIRTELPPNSSSEERAARASYIASLLTKDNATREATIESLNEFWQSQDTKFAPTDLGSPLSIENNTITLDVYYQDPKYQTWFVRFDNVHFFESTQAISQAGAEGSSDPLYEVYSWIASKKTIKLIKEVV